MAVGDKVKVGAAGVELSVIDKTKEGFEKAKANAKKETQTLQNQLNHIKIQMDTRLAQMQLKDVEKFHKYLKNRLEEKIKLNVDSRSIERTKAEIQAVEAKLKSLQAASVGSKSSSKIGDLFSGVANLDSKFMGFGIAAAAVGTLVSESVKASIEIEGIRNAFDKLNDPSLLDNLRKATRGTISDMELMKASVKASHFKIPLEDLATFFEFAQKRASQTGESVDYLVESIVLGIGRKSPRILDNLGISAIALKEKFGDVGLESASIADVSKAMGDIVRDELSGMGDVALTTKDKITQINTAFENGKVLIGDFFVGATNGFLDLIELAGKYSSIQSAINSDLEKIANQAKNTQSMWQKAISEAKSGALTESAKSNEDQLKKLIGETENKINSLLSEFTKGNIKYSGDLQNDLDQLTTKLEIYKSAHKELSTIFDPYKNSIGAVKERLDWVNDRIDKTVKGTKEYNKLIKEQQSLESFLEKPKTPKEKKKIELDFNEFELIQEDYAWLDEVIAKENELAKIRDENLQVYIDARNELSEDEKKELEERLKKEEEIHNLRMNAISEFGNALEGLSAHGKTFVSYFNAALQAALKISDALDTMKTDQLSGILGIASGGLGFITKLLPGMAKGGSLTNFGGGNVSYQPHQKFASGVNNFVVPPGYNRDNYLVGVQSGEKLNVTPANARNNSASGIDNKMLGLIAGRVGALNGNLIEYMGVLVNATVNKTLETALKGNDIVISYDTSKQIKNIYRGKVG